MLPFPHMGKSWSVPPILSIDVHSQIPPWKTFAKLAHTGIAAPRLAIIHPLSQCDMWYLFVLVLFVNSQLEPCQVTAKLHGEFSIPSSDLEFVSNHQKPSHPLESTVVGVVVECSQHPKLRKRTRRSFQFLTLQTLQSQTGGSICSQPSPRELYG